MPDFVQYRQPEYYQVLYEAFCKKQQHVHVCHGCFLQSKDAVSEIRENVTSNERTTEPTYMGYLYFKQFQFMIDTPLGNSSKCNGIDIHGLVAEKGLRAPFHAVVDQKSAESFENDQRSIFPTSIRDLPLRFRKTSCCDITIEHYAKDNEGEPIFPNKKWNIEIFFVEEVPGLRKDSYQKGTNNLTADEVLQYGVLEFQDGGTKKRKKEVDATFVIGRSNQRGVDKPKETLLVARFYNLIKKCLKRNEVIFLYQNLMKRMEQPGGIERNRTGGAGGRFEGVSLELLDMISASSLTPRKRRGTWILPVGTECVVLYINSDEKVTKWKYSHPYRGGKIAMKKFDYSFFLKFGTTLRPFVEAKIWTAKILSQCRWLENVVPLAALSELRTLDEAVSSRIVYKGGENNKYRYRNKILYSYSKLNRWSINWQPVSQHQDHFGRHGKTSGLENKICFSSKHLYHLNKFGRGGAPANQTSNSFTFCILDWPGGARRRAERRRAAELGGDGNDLRPMTRREAMRFYNFPDPQRITLAVWRDFVVQNFAGLSRNQQTRHLLGDAQQMREYRVAHREHQRNEREEHP